MSAEAYFRALDGKLVRFRADLRSRRQGEAVTRDEHVARFAVGTPERSYRFVGVLCSSQMPAAFTFGVWRSGEPAVSLRYPMQRDSYGILQCAPQFVVHREGWTKLLGAAKPKQADVGKGYAELADIVHDGFGEFERLVAKIRAFSNQSKIRKSNVRTLNPSPVAEDINKGVICAMAAAAGASALNDGLTEVPGPSGVIARAIAAALAVFLGFLCASDDGEPYGPPFPGTFNPFTDPSMNPFGINPFNVGASNSSDSSDVTGPDDGDYGDDGGGTPGGEHGFEPFPKFMDPDPSGTGAA
jgi:hypothetical protein